MSKEVVVIVGCGGVALHSLSAIAVETRLRAENSDEYRALFFDPDSFGLDNLGRQIVRPEPKAELLADTFTTYTGFPTVACIEEFNLNGSEKIVKDADRVVFVVMCDTAEGRQKALEVAERLHSRKREVWFVVAGNDKTSGQAFGWRVGEGDGIRDNNPAVEELLTENGTQCGREVEQSLEGNMCTAVCLRRVLAGLREGAKWVAARWGLSLEGTVRVWTE